MTKEDILTVLSEKIVEDGDDYIIETRANRFIRLGTFVSMFADAQLKYDSLVSHRNCTNEWKAIFDAWKEQGIIT